MTLSVAGRLRREFSSTQIIAEANQRVGVLVLVPELLREFGTEPMDIVASAGLDLSLLVDPDNVISFVAMGRLLRECVARTRSPHFGLLLGQRWSLSGLGLPGQLSQHAPTVGLALLNFVKYQHINSHGAVTYLSRKGGEAGLHYAIYQKGVESTDQIQAGAMAIAMNAMRSLCGPDWLPSEVHLAFRQPGDILPYRRFFQVPIRFNSQQTSLLFPAHWLEYPIAGADPRAYEALKKVAASTGGIGTADQVRRAVRTLIQDDGISGDQVAHSLPMHRRTLNRKLRALGTTFRKILDEIRFEITCEMLRDTDMGIMEIAAMLGYADASAFTRAFRRWSGITPAQWRVDNRAET